jgi:WD40 repeat protein
MNHNVFRNVRSSFYYDTPLEVRTCRNDLRSSTLRADIDRRCGDSKTRQPLLRMLKEREVGEMTDTLSKQCLSSTNRVPNALSQNISSSRSERAYNVCWSKSGRICVAAWQDESVRVYIERSPLEDERDQSPETSNRVCWRETARVQARNVAWTVTSVDTSPDESAIAYSTISSEVHILRLDVLKQMMESNDNNDEDEEEGNEENDDESYHFSYSSAATPKLPSSPSATQTASFTDPSSRSFSGASASSAVSTIGREEHGVESHVAVDFTKEDEGADHSNNGIDSRTSSGASNRRRGYRYGFGIFSVKFSVGGSELVAGCNDGFIRIMDLSRALVSDKVQAHKDDINSVCFAGGVGEAADVVISGSDEIGTPLKVWDRRVLNAPVSVLFGHQSGITHVSPRGDGRTILSVSKDQTIKIWDLRRVSSNASSAASARHWKHFDYRFEANPSIFKNNMHPDDCSINTLYGPLVLQTLIRANFSPLDTTGGRFICSGSADGCVYIYDVLTGDVVDKLSGHAACVRDVAWHPSKPLIASASWDGFVKLWSFNSNVSERLGAKQWKKDRDAFSRFKIRDGEGSDSEINYDNEEDFEDYDGNEEEEEDDDDDDEEEEEVEDDDDEEEEEDDDEA